MWPALSAFTRVFDALWRLKGVTPVFAGYGGMRGSPSRITP
jgi:hypothetical protein